MNEKTRTFTVMLCGAPMSGKSLFCNKVLNYRCSDMAYHMTRGINTHFMALRYYNIVLIDMPGDKGELERAKHHCDPNVDILLLFVDISRETGLFESSETYYCLLNAGVKASHVIVIADCDTIERKKIKMLTMSRFCGSIHTSNLYVTSIRRNVIKDAFNGIVKICENMYLEEQKFDDGEDEPRHGWWRKIMSWFSKRKINHDSNYTKLK